MDIEILRKKTMVSNNYQSGWLVHPRQSGLPHSLRGCLCGANVAVTKVGSPLSRGCCHFKSEQFPEKRSQAFPAAFFALDCSPRHPNDAISSPPTPRLLALALLFLSPPRQLFVSAMNMKNLLLSCSLLFSRQLYSSFAHDCRSSSSSII
jgi:hypothetical protein